MDGWLSKCLAKTNPVSDCCQIKYDRNVSKPLCASLDGFTLHVATRAGGLDAAGREALLRYVLRPPAARERVEQRPFGLVRITRKKAYADGTVAVDNPLSLLCRLATSVPPPRLHTVRYAGVLASASPWRSRLAPSLPTEPTLDKAEPGTARRAGGYRPWAERPLPCHRRGADQSAEPFSRPRSALLIPSGLRSHAKRERLPVLRHAVDGRKQLVHRGDEGDLRRFALVPQALVVGREPGGCTGRR